MTAEVINLHGDGTLVGDGVSLSPDDILENNKGQFVRLCIIGVMEDGEYAVAGTDSAAETMMLCQWASNFLVNNLVARG